MWNRSLSSRGRVNSPPCYKLDFELFGEFDFVMRRFRNGRYKTSLQPAANRSAPCSRISRKPLACLPLPPAASTMAAVAVADRRGVGGQCPNEIFIARALCDKFYVVRLASRRRGNKCIGVLRMAEKGRGLALALAWRWSAGAHRAGSNYTPLKSLRGGSYSRTV